MADRPLKTVILAAGKSTRMKSDTPKVLHKLAGKPLLDWVLAQANALDSEQDVLIVGHGAEQVEKRYATRERVACVRQEPQLGTGHAVMQARQQLDGMLGDVAVLCGDVPLLRPETLKALLETHTEHGAACTVLTTRVDDPTGYGRIVRDDIGRVRGIVEHRDMLAEHEGINEINTGTYIFDAPALLDRLDQLTTDNAQGEYYLTDVVSLLCRDGLDVRAHVCADPAEVMGINTRVQLAEAERVMRDRICRHWMLEGVTITDPNSTWIEADAAIGRDTVIHPCSVIRAGVQIGPGCEIGPFAHLRPGTQLGAGCKVGAFVETKNAVYGDGAKSGHLAYLGDVTLGANVNIGAGSIVANYDGKAKHHTEIGDGAFIGCGTVLVAPVKVGRNAQTGANTVVLRGKDVPDDTVVIGIPARELRKRRDQSSS